MPTGPHNFTTKPRKITQAGELQWGGESQWNDQIGQNDGIIMKNGSISIIDVAGPTIGLVAYWPLNGVLTDSIGTANGTSHGASPTTSPRGGAYSFTSSGYISVPNSDLPELTDEVTVALWAYPDGNGGNYGNMLNRYNSSGWAGGTHGYALRYRKSYDYWQGSVSLDDKTEVRAAGTSVTLNTWTHLALTYDGSEARLYENGSLTGTATGSGALYATSEDLLLGRGQTDNDAFGGKIDDVRVYNRALSAPRVAELFTATK